MKEFYRLLVPGGLLALTTRGRPFFDFCENLQGQDVEGYLKGLSMMFSSFPDARARYDRGEFVHSNAEGVTGGGPRSSDFYGETFIPETYAKNAYSKWFELEQFLFKIGQQTHPIMFFSKKVALPFPAMDIL